LIRRRNNVLTVNNNYGQTPASALTSWMQPTGWAPPRKIQLATRLSF
jgi:hypothetical protein